MVDRICESLTNRIRKEMPEIDEERAEVIQYGIQLLLGEFPKLIILFLIAFICKIGWLTVFAFIALLPYRISSGGFHLKTHWGCLIATNLFYLGIVFLGNSISFYPEITKYVVIGFNFLFSTIMITKYAPADTINVPILSTKERKKKKIASYGTMFFTLLIATFLKGSISNILILGVFAQSICITKIAYKLTRNEYGYELYKEPKNVEKDVLIS